MLQATDLEVRAGARLLLEPTTFRVNPGDKIGLVGRNGAGKTTMMRILAGEGLPAAGTVTRRGEIGYLPQDPRETDTGMLARNRILSARGLDSVLVRLRKYEKLMASTTGDEQEDAMASYARAEAQLMAAGGYGAEAEAARIAANLGLPDRALGQPLHELSGGQRRRIELARILFSGADTLLLDEPTNHLDADSIVWLREFVKNYDGGVMMISHDVELLGETVTKVFHLDANRTMLDQYSMNWAKYLEQRAVDEKRRKRERQSAERKAAQLRLQAEKLGAKATKATAAQNMARRAEKLLASTEGVRAQDKVAKIAFPSPASCGKTPLMAKDLTKTYGSLEVFTGVDLAVDKGSRVVILGLNGAGKTTLLRLLTGIENPDTGEVVPGHGLKLGYFAQEHDLLEPEKSVLQNMMDAAPDLNETEARRVLGGFLFTGDDDYKPAGVLSGGEKTRLALATLVVSSANVLLLDEPTNNLDPASRKEVLDAIRRYEGAIVLVTHDEGAVEALEPDRVIVLPDGTEDLWSEDYAELISLA
ncbi:ABC-F family ATP-binding cassette domain-containing protein [Propionimicrobium sp. PCR01-08-3]|uniref:ABC-F family ATP-binding cassette domain-containing protein n=1 Tax=Propionimicrobium sp. PCR01-08-3 TaxID=3052086 RepID=UPI00255C575F|nr:ABC-F family ATP-binding cassette domain-containing protein [Propionimicrobium sp. PCR01-08-3]WIY81606.1 ABC-F family ATP-binding cassette domain-containing protein [Propionimicrobium sp. PCR01-08-3]